MDYTFEKGWTADELEQNYYEWLTNWVPKWKYGYSLLLRHLYETPFRVTLLMDENRVGDGLSLRTRYVYEQQMSTIERDILKVRRPCSVLEVMIALGLRFEEEYMSPQATEENPIEAWFSPMIGSLGLADCDDLHYDPDVADFRILIFLDRVYRPNGLGGLFYIPNAHEDMREIELWQQMMLWYKAQNK